MSSEVNKKRKNAKSNDDDLVMAIAGVLSGEFTSYGASKYFNVCNRTLDNKIKQVHMDNIGAKTLFNQIEEKILIETIQDWADKGQGFDRARIINLASRMKKKKTGKDEPVSKDWFEGFKQRHPSLVLRVPSQVYAASARVTEIDIRGFFDSILKFLIKYDLTHLLAAEYAYRWFNCDETGYEFDPKSRKIYTEKGRKFVPAVSSSKPGSRMSCMYMFSADGQSYPMQMILRQSRRGNIEADLEFAKRQTKSDCYFSWNKNGYQTQSSFEDYIKNCWYPSLIANGITLSERERVFIYVDGHKSHDDANFLDWCKSHHIEILKLYPNSTRIIQMCDVAMFSPAKSAWKSNVSEWKRNNPNKEFEEVEAFKVLKKTNDQFIKEDSIKNGFFHTGTFPLNAENVMWDRVIGESVQDSSCNLTNVDVVPDNSSLSSQIIQNPNFDDITPHTSAQMNHTRDDNLNDSVTYDVNYNSMGDFNDLLTDFYYHFNKFKPILVKDDAMKPLVKPLVEMIFSMKEVAIKKHRCESETESPAIHPTNHQTPSTSRSIDYSEILTPAPPIVKPIPKRIFPQSFSGVVTSPSELEKRLESKGKREKAQQRKDEKSAKRINETRTTTAGIDKKSKIIKKETCDNLTFSDETHNVVQIDVKRGRGRPKGSKNKPKKL